MTFDHAISPVLLKNHGPTTSRPASKRRLVFQAAWAILINRYAGVEDVCFGYDTGDEGISSAMPDCNQTLICRANITPENPLGETIRSMMRHLNDAKAYSNYSIGEAQKLLGLQDKPLLNSGLHFQQQGQHKRNLNQFDIVAKIMIHDDASLSISVRTRSSYCSAVRTADVAHTFAKTLLETLSAHPESMIGELNIVSQRDYDQIMEWNKDVPQSVETTFHEYFECIAQQMPDCPAIFSRDGNFTYRELDTLSTRLARRLADLGVGLETLVLICFDKSAYAIVSMLGIMKAGCAFVAIDPSYPASRIQAILLATKATIVVADPAHEHIFQNDVAHVVKLDAQSAEELPLTPATVASRPSAFFSNLAYVVFTSGSTGSPKGFQVEHRALCTAAQHLATPMRIDSSTRHLNFAAFTFDLSYGDIFVTLAQGACAIVRMEVNSACLVPSVARILRPEDVPRLQTLSLGGEALVQENLAIWAPRIALNNMYGRQRGQQHRPWRRGLALDHQSYRSQPTMPSLRQSMVILPSTGVFTSRLVAVVVLKSISASQEATHELKAVTGRAKEQSVAEVAKIKAFLASRVPH
ncbi:acetyl-CoA synthetase-like protein [Aspergillus ibericus CBS 121593]|uniref:Acetyl-CoA synthetase-like protein n=1 Tax=Aspergillus ibericus CBS 121593 TaxID=1448316 RepID=A0A395GNS6_9EURO|nr:acetyl-CoA synthetase-like protein [Aspergillus ibericus CBS 121593]RAK97155.1 acetyl-CoA synthetase-like protein [Aspergillus ibericus CBS 121593]